MPFYQVKLVPSTLHSLVLDAMIVFVDFIYDISGVVQLRYDG